VEHAFASHLQLLYALMFPPRVPSSGCGWLPVQLLSPPTPKPRSLLLWPLWTQQRCRIRHKLRSQQTGFLSPTRLNFTPLSNKTIKALGHQTSVYRVNNVPDAYRTRTVTAKHETRLIRGQPRAQEPGADLLEPAAGHLPHRAADGRARGSCVRPRPVAGASAHNDRMIHVPHMFRRAHIVPVYDLGQSAGALYPAVDESVCFQLVSALQNLH